MPKIREPKYASIASDIRKQIEKKVLKPGDRLPSMAEMRRQHGITPTTVSKVYSILQQERLIECGRGRGTFVAIPPAKPRTGIVGIHGLTHGDNPYSHPFTAGLMRGFIEASTKTNVELLLLNNSSARDWELIDGVITHASEAPELLRQLPDGIPSVVTLLSVPEVVSVVADERAGIGLLVQHLVSLGHRRIAAILDPFSPLRLSGYREALDGAGIDLNPDWIRRLDVRDRQAPNYHELGYHTIHQWLREGWPDLGCTAILVQNDDAANGVIRALREADIAVPGQVSVTGFDGTEVGHYLRPSLTTIEMPLHQIGLTAMELLNRQIAGEKMQPLTLSLPVSLKVGESSAPPR
jgi:DNA-binding LacI/PurR family transcriptional regulator